ncbi:carboxypeptidase-like regulatory domain-containing protein [Segetibacter sp. 3557_3]|uniref:DUF5686 family protein n=1 Tax=Segetibacter sp. 3557_3 TaxID=2547429 RepID=UPI0010587F8F|nr:DUF5686 family protein [Segetibacter sp. 3557_3]TDH23346.1 carboxypeptidase-like regulatory domain-containing protein [Segetibacter sp. 3557_3]
MRPKIPFLLLAAMLFFIPGSLFSQRKTIAGSVRDQQSDEPIPFASVQLKNATAGSLTDSLGKFVFSYSSTGGDTLLVTSVGYNPLAVVLPKYQDSTSIEIKLAVAQVGKEAVVKVKFNRALWLWNRIIKNKYKFDPAQFENFSYEIYNKLELDLINVDQEKLAGKRLLKPFNFILQNIDTTEGKPFLPVFLTETLSDFYVQHNPRRTREIIKASKTNGIENESVTKFLGGTYQNVNIYLNYIPVLDKQFVSPFHERGDNYYNFKLLDTQYLNNKRLVHLRFTPKSKGGNTFEGDCWVVDSSYAIQKITLRPSVEANINFVEKLTLIQEFRLVNDTTWFLSKDRFVVDISPMGKSRGGFKGRKTATYRNVALNQESIAAILKENKKPEQVDVLPDAEIHTDSFWVQSRHEKLNKNESDVYKMIDTIQSIPAFKKYNDAITFLGTGYKNIGNYRIGPWYNWVSGNLQEGTRVRFDLATNYKFNQKLFLHGYLAYGFGDKKFKGKAEIFVLPKKHPRFYLYASYSKDRDFAQNYYDEVSTDNIFSLAIRKSGVPVKYLSLEEKRFEAFKETNFGLSFLLEVTHKQYDPLMNLPGKLLFSNNIPGDPLRNFETAIRFRFAYMEKFIENSFYRTSLGSELPVVELRVNKGWAGVMRSSYNYHKVSGSISDYLKIPPFGSFYYNLFGGRVFGTVPYPFLEIHPGNEIYYYNKYAFNMMNRFEYISDRYAGFNVEHNIGNGLFKYIPITRKLKFRQFWSAKGLIGGLSTANRNLNFVGNQSFATLNDKVYLEVGTGVDNILKVLRLDFIWRVLPQPLPKEQNKRFGVFASFKVGF